MGGPRGATGSVQLTQSQVEEWQKGELYVRFKHKADLDMENIAPADPELFTDGFESGDTSAWSNTVP